MLDISSPLFFFTFPCRSRMTQNLLHVLGTKPLLPYWVTLCPPIIQCTREHIIYIYIYIYICYFLFGCLVTSSGGMYGAFWLIYLLNLCDMSTRRVSISPHFTPISVSFCFRVALVDGEGVQAISSFLWLHSPLPTPVTVEVRTRGLMFSC
ncbi:T. brucei spp.-specific protein [Trypanosoma brucei gambiense DAL972]|uniref:T. brucei spp.-specific protein n=1 Tax=Trypanosoma brucei gambiense (strain MHOM/CI/86/DAL972) TaxID=679716 RepID=D0A4X0_TRYB9|nr:T. brucei spp.-specific protein [Trypanosoma brucei gambiense DAL972]CBH16314.1 T. brucei spp.-specific protein [Trypanosoma brucei gambiense DAL972]|eukprot:XP_011778578.1 T. brucei spp.-specific protein [Trypanosoma brucei gambiense DAL972]